MRTFSPAQEVCDDHQHQGPGCGLEDSSHWHLAELALGVPGPPWGGRWVPWVYDSLEGLTGSRSSQPCSEHPLPDIQLQFLPQFFLRHRSPSHVRMRRFSQNFTGKLSGERALVSFSRGSTECLLHTEALAWVQSGLSSCVVQVWPAPVGRDCGSAHSWRHLRGEGAMSARTPSCPVLPLRGGLG